mmetsp:Transcript_16687/g.27359  ORF Transcript_16687/g.27359 Transcript_16687/m.27359 type:complete len:210 (-) Transcript_16687:251-880(-)
MTSSVVVRSSLSIAEEAVQLGYSLDGANILKIARMGHPILKERAQEVVDPSSKEVGQIVADMLKTADDIQCTGLAAPQVHIPLRIVFFRVAKNAPSNSKYKHTPEFDPEGVPLTVMINPVIQALTEEQEQGWEGCLSVPGLMGRVPRYTAIRYSFQTTKGETVTKTARGFHARVVQHECDHLDGILYPQRMTDMASLGFREEVFRYVED